MQTVRDATILTILILLFASVRIGPVAETDGSFELPQVQTASALPFFSGAQSTESETVIPKSSAPAPTPGPAAMPAAVQPFVQASIPPAIQIVDASVLPSVLPKGLTEGFLQALPEGTITIQSSAEAEVQIFHWVETIEREVEAVEAAEDSQDLMVQIAVMLEEVGDAAITELGDHAREAIGRVECPKSRFKLNTRF